MDDVEVALVSFLCADTAVTDLIRTPPAPPRIFPNVVPQNQPRDQPTIVYEVLTQMEGFALAMGPHGLPRATILLECRAATARQAKLLRSLVLSSRGGNPDNRKLNGFAGSLGEGYVVQMAKAENSYYEFEPPLRDGERGIHIAGVELLLWWNNLSTA